MQRYFKRLTAWMLAMALTATCAVGAAAYNDKDVITNTGVNLSAPQTLAVVNPAGGSATTTAAYYYITGTSDPDQPLTCNGWQVASQGQFGSFGVYVPLSVGKNTFELSQGGNSVKVKITRVSSPSQLPVTTINNIRSMYPSYHLGVRAGDEVTLSCTAPSGASVTASIGGKQITLKQSAAAATGVPAVFKAKTTLSSAGPGTVDLGKVTYTLSYNGTVKDYYSTGSVYVASETLVVQSTGYAAMTYEKPGSYTPGNYHEVLRSGTVDYVVDQTDSMYKLSMGGWSDKELYTPVTGSAVYTGRASGATMTADAKTEVYSISTKANPSFYAYVNSEKAYVRLHNFTGLDSLPTGDSILFSYAEIFQDGSNTIITFKRKPGAEIWGYSIEYTDDATNIVFTKPPKLAGGSKPLTGITVALDPGHGGNDPGALGPTGTTGPTEKDLNLATAIAVRNRLESLGAKVIMTRTDDSNKTFDQRLTPALEQRADFYISLHHNSTTAGADGTKPNGIEVYYFETLSKDFANKLNSKLVAYTGRPSRRVARNVFRVTLNTYAPSVLVEFGFMPNPVEYDLVRGKTSLFNTANAIGDAIIEYLS